MMVDADIKRRKKSSLNIRCTYDVCIYTNTFYLTLRTGVPNIVYNKIYNVRYVLIMVAPVGSESRCRTRLFLMSFGAITNM